MGAEREFLKIFPWKARLVWEKTAEIIEQVCEIRLRAERPVLIYTHQGEFFQDVRGNFTKDCRLGRRADYEEIQELINFLCQDSRYAFEEEIKQGYLTVQGGHRIGIAGETALARGREVQTLKHIASINIRVAHQLPGVAREILPYVYGGNRIKNTLIVSPPGCGKTTLLRDMVRRISDGNSCGSGKTVGLIDERGELAACFQGIPQLDVGMRTDVLDGCPKAPGMVMLLRSMAPQVIAVDELGSEAEAEAVSRLANCGCSILATVHGTVVEEIEKKEMFRLLFRNRVFECFLLLRKEAGKFYITVVQEGEETRCFAC